MITLLLLIIAIALTVIAVRLRRRRHRRRVVAIIALAIATFYIVKYQLLPSPSSNRDRKVGSEGPSQMWDGRRADRKRDALPAHRCLGGATRVNQRALGPPRGKNIVRADRAQLRRA
jgi:hypothetical protein